MLKKITLVFAFCMSLNSFSFAGDSLASMEYAGDGSNDVIEAWGGTRNGGDC